MTRSRVGLGLLVALVSLKSAGLFASGSSESWPPVRMAGKLDMSFFADGKWETNTFAVKLEMAPDSWCMELESGENLQRTTWDGEKTAWVSYYPGNAADASLNSSEIVLFPKDRPFDLRKEEHVWMAFLSHKTFLERPLPIEDATGLCIREAGVFDSLEILMNATSPRAARWHNLHSDNHADAPRIEGTYGWLAETNVSGIRLPLTSQLKMTVQYPGAEAVPVSISSFRIEEVSIAPTQPRTSIEVTGRSSVSDYRSGDVKARQALNYVVQDGKIPAMTSRKVEAMQSFTEAFQAKGKPESWAKRVWFVILAVIALGGAGWIVAASFKKKERME